MYEIIDDDGVIFSGSEDEMIKAFDEIINDDVFSEYHLDGWKEDLKLVHVLNRYK